MAAPDNANPSVEEMMSASSGPEVAGTAAAAPANPSPAAPFHGPGNPGMAAAGAAAAGTSALPAVVQQATAVGVGAVHATAPQPQPLNYAQQQQLYDNSNQLMDGMHRVRRDLGNLHFMATQTTAVQQQQGAVQAATTMAIERGNGMIQHVRDNQIPAVQHGITTAIERTGERIQASLEAVGDRIINEVKQFLGNGRKSGPRSGPGEGSDPKRAKMGDLKKIGYCTKCAEKGNLKLFAECAEHNAHMN